MNYRYKARAFKKTAPIKIGDAVEIRITGANSHFGRRTNIYAVNLRGFVVAVLINENCPEHGGPVVEVEISGQGACFFHAGDIKLLSRRTKSPKPTLENWLRTGLNKPSGSSCLQVNGDKALFFWIDKRIAAIMDRRLIRINKKSPSAAVIEDFANRIGLKIIKLPEIDLPLVNKRM